MSIEIQNAFLAMEDEEIEEISILASHYINTNDPSFVYWLRKQYGFQCAKNRLEKREVANIDCLEKIENICARVLIHVFANPKINKQAVVAQKKINAVRKLAKKLKDELESLDSFVFESEVDQLLLQKILSDILKSNDECVLNSGATHSQLQKEIFIKTFIYQLASAFDEYDLSDSLITDIAIDITGVFFHKPPDKSYYSQKTKEIKENMIKDKIKLSKTAKELLEEYFKNGTNRPISD